MRRTVILHILVLGILLVGCTESPIPLPVTETPTFSPSQTATLPPTPTSDPAIIIEENFSSSISGWWVDNTSYGTLYYANGKYRIYGKQSEYLTWSIYDEKPIVDGVYSVEYEFLSKDAANTGVDIYWRFRDKDSYYCLQIWGNGTYSIGKLFDNEFSELIRIGKGESLHPGSETNKVTSLFMVAISMFTSMMCTKPHSQIHQLSMDILGWVFSPAEKVMSKYYLTISQYMIMTSRMLILQLNLNPLQRQYTRRSRGWSGAISDR
jgi:hypothetical protein